MNGCRCIIVWVEKIKHYSNFFAVIVDLKVSVVELLCNIWRRFWFFLLFFWCTALVLFEDTYVMRTPQCLTECKLTVRKTSCFLNIISQRANVTSDLTVMFSKVHSLSARSKDINPSYVWKPFNLTQMERQVLRVSLLKAPTWMKVSAEANGYGLYTENGPNCVCGATVATVCN